MEKQELYDIAIDEEVDGMKKGDKPQVKALPAEGVPWERMKFKVNAKDFAALMREYNIRTLEDVKTNTGTVVRLMQRLYTVDLGAVLAFAQEYEEVTNAE